MADSKTVVLVADDEPSMLAMVSAHLRSKGFSVLQASDGDQAWELAHEHLPDLIILDVMMPGMGGWELCKRIRETVSLAHTGVIMLTGIGDTLNEMTSPLYGADEYIDKPFEFSNLDRKVDATLARRRDGALGRPDFDTGDEAPASSNFGPGLAKTRQAKRSKGKRTASHQTELRFLAPPAKTKPKPEKPVNQARTAPAKAASVKPAKATKAAQTGAPAKPAKATARPLAKAAPAKSTKASAIPTSTKASKASTTSKAPKAAKSTKASTTSKASKAAKSTKASTTSKAFKSAKSTKASTTSKASKAAKSTKASTNSKAPKVASKSAKPAKRAGAPGKKASTKSSKALPKSTPAKLQSKKGPSKPSLPKRRK